MNDDLVSIIICSYNNWPDLKLAIDSALNQSYERTQVIVVDNGSFDATRAQVPLVFGEAVHFVSQQGGSDARAYNTGFELATGRYVQFMDGDDILLSHKIADQVAAFQQHPDTDIVYGDIRRFVSDPGEHTVFDFETWDYPDVLAMLLSFDGNGAGLGTLNTLLSRSTIERVGAWDEALYNTDLDYMIRAAWNGCRFRRAGGLVGLYRKRSGQMSANRHAMLRGAEQVWCKAEAYVNAEPYRSILARTLAQQRLFMALADVETRRAEARKLLELARTGHPDHIPRWAYFAARAMIEIPGARELLMRHWFGPIRSALRRPLGFPIDRFRSAPD